MAFQRSNSNTNTEATSTRKAAAYLNVYVTAKSGNNRKLSGIPLFAEDPLHASIIAKLTADAAYLDDKLSLTFVPISGRPTDDNEV